MKDFRALALSLCFGLGLAASPAAAGPSNWLQARIHASVQDLVRKVRATGDAAGKRALLEAYLGGMDRDLARARGSALLPEADKRALEPLAAKFRADLAALDGAPGQAAVADADLDRFAAFVQQDLEQAAVGIYLSTGAAIILVVILVLLIL